MSRNKPYVSSAIVGACYGFGFMPIDRSVFSKSKKDKQFIKHMKKQAINKGTPKSIFVFSCNETDHGTFSGKH